MDESYKTLQSVVEIFKFSLNFGQICELRFKKMKKVMIKKNKECFIQMNTKLIKICKFHFLTYFQKMLQNKLKAYKGFILDFG